MCDTYINLFRSSLNHRYFTNVNLWHFYQYCMLKATYSPYATMVGNQTVQLERGQFVFGRKVASKETGLSEQEIRTCLNVLQTDKKVTIKATNKFSIITVIEFDSWQNKPEVANQQINQQITNKEPQTIRLINKPKKTCPPTGDHQTFLKWWCYSFKIVTGNGYVVSGGRDGKLISEILSVHPLKKAICLAACFLTQEDDWLGEKRDIPMFKAQINKLPMKTSDFESWREMKLLPPNGVMLEEWKFWEVADAA